MGKTILIVDDSASVRQVVGIALRGAGYEVIEGVDGVDGLSKLDGTKVHLIISDVNMPRMDGITFVREVRSCLRTSSPRSSCSPQSRRNARNKRDRQPGRRPGWSSRFNRRRCSRPSPN